MRMVVPQRHLFASLECAQARAWILQMGKPMGIRAVQFSDQDFKAALEASVSEGRPLLIENVEETIDPILDPILEQKFVRRGVRRWVNLERGDLLL